MKQFESSVNGVDSFWTFAAETNCRPRPDDEAQPNMYQLYYFKPNKVKKTEALIAQQVESKEVMTNLDADIYFQICQVQKQTLIQWPGKVDSQIEKQLAGQPE